MERREGCSQTYQSLGLGPPKFPTPQKTHEHDLSLSPIVSVAEARNSV